MLFKLDSNLINYLSNRNQDEINELIDEITFIAVYRPGNFPANSYIAITITHNRFNQKDVPMIHRMCIPNQLNEKFENYLAFPVIDILTHYTSEEILHFLYQVVPISMMTDFHELLEQYPNNFFQIIYNLGQISHHKYNNFIDFFVAVENYAKNQIFPSRQLDIQQLFALENINVKK